MPGCTLDQQAVAALLKEESIRSLDLRRTNVPVGALVNASFFEDLEFLTLEGCELTEHFLESLAKCRNIKDLWLSSTNLTDSSMRYLKPLRSLTTLVFHSTDVSDKSIPILIGLKKLRHVGTRGTRISLKGEFRLSIELPTCWIEGPHVVLSGTAGRNYEFSSAGGGVTDFIRMATAQKLLLVDVSGLQLDANAVTALNAEESIIWLYIGRTNLDTEGLVSASFFENLELLDVEGLTVSKEVLDALSRCKRLIQLRLKSTNIDDALVPHLAQLARQTRLNYLELDHTRISDQSVELLGKMVHLRVLSIRYTRISDKGLSLLRKKLPDCHVSDIVWPSRAGHSVE